MCADLGARTIRDELDALRVMGINPVQALVVPRVLAATTVALAVVFLGSVVIGRPVIARLAHDFCPLAPEVAARPAVLRLFGGLTVLWAGVHIVTAAITFGMLVSMPVATFVAFKTLTCLGVTIGAIVITIMCALRVVRNERLVFAFAGI
jgi:phospholipid/cholesterol/gamma-HCH transport system permease protein